MYQIWSRDCYYLVLYTNNHIYEAPRFQVWYKMRKSVLVSMITYYNYNSWCAHWLWSCSPVPLWRRSNEDYRPLLPSCSFFFHLLHFPLTFSFPRLPFHSTYPCQLPCSWGPTGLASRHPWLSRWETASTDGSWSMQLIVHSMSNLNDNCHV